LRCIERLLRDVDAAVHEQVEHAVDDRRRPFVPAPAARAVLQLVEVAAAELVEHAHLTVDHVLATLHAGPGLA
jgi:hypothetical protein